VRLTPFHHLYIDVVLKDYSLAWLLCRYYRNLIANLISFRLPATVMISPLLLFIVILSTLIFITVLHKTHGSKAHTEILKTKKYTKAKKRIFSFDLPLLLQYYIHFFLHPNFIEA